MKIRHILILAIILNLIGLLYPIHPDEIVFLDSARQLVEGAVPYVGFVDNKPPGIYLTLVPFAHLVGEHVWVLRLMVFLVNMLSSLLIMKVGERAFGKKEGIYAAVLFLFLTPVFHGNYVLTEPFMMLFLLLAVYIGIGSQNSILIAGICAGIAVLYKQPAFLTALALGSIVYVRTKHSIRAVIAYISGMLLPIIVLGIYLSVNNALIAGFWEVVIVNVRSYHPAPLHQLIQGLGKILVPILGILAILILQRKYLTRSRSLLVLALAAMPVLLFRPYHHYWMQILPFATLILVSLPTTDVQQKIITLNLILIAIGYTWYGVSVAYPRSLI